MRELRALLFILCLAAAGGAAAVTIHVPAEQPTIQAGIDVAASGDTVMLADGSYRGDGNRDLDFHGRALVLRSAGGDPEACVIDCEGSEGEPHRGIRFHAAARGEQAVEGIGIVNGWAFQDHYEGGGGVSCEAGASPVFRNCRFENNRGTALFSHSGDGATLIDCRFVGNVGRNGGGVCAVVGYFHLVRCEFVGNEAELAGGGLHGHAANFEFEDCLFRENIAAVGAAIDMIYGCDALFTRCRVDENVSQSSFWNCTVNLHGMVTAEFVDCTFAENASDGGYVLVTSKTSHGTLRGCTFWGNSVPNGTIVFLGESDGRVENTVIAGSPAGRALYVATVLSLTCTNLHGNAGGDWVDGLESYLGVDGNISQDPMFCNPAAGEFTLHALSPCAPHSPPNPECDLIGAWPVACDQTPAANISWSAVKALYP